MRPHRDVAFVPLQATAHEIRRHPILRVPRAIGVQHAGHEDIGLALLGLVQIALLLALASSELVLEGAPQDHLLFRWERGAIGARHEPPADVVPEVIIGEVAPCRAAVDLAKKVQQLWSTLVIPTGRETRIDDFEPPRECVSSSLFCRGGDGLIRVALQQHFGARLQHGILKFGAFVPRFDHLISQERDRLRPELAGRCGILEPLLEALEEPPRLLRHDAVVLARLQGPVRRVRRVGVRIAAAQAFSRGNLAPGVFILERRHRLREIELDVLSRERGLNPRLLIDERQAAARHLGARLLDSPIHGPERARACLRIRQAARDARLRWEPEELGHQFAWTLLGSMLPPPNPLPYRCAKDDAPLRSVVPVRRPPAAAACRPWNRNRRSLARWVEASSSPP